MLADLRQRDLELLEHGQQPLHRPEVPAEALHGRGDLAGVERVVDPPVPGEPVAHLAGQAVHRLTGDQGQLGIGDARRGVDEPHGCIEQIRRDKGGENHARTIPPVQAGTAGPSMRS